MAEEYFIRLSELVEKFNLTELQVAPEDREKKIFRKEVNRPGLFLAGFEHHFIPERIQILGKTEYEFLESLGEEKRDIAMRNLMERKPVCVIFCHGRKVLLSTRKLAEEFGLSVDDLFSVCQKLPKEAKQPDGVHFNELGNEALGKSIAESIKKALL